VAPYIIDIDDEEKHAYDRQRVKVQA